jgi:hypothetical protein
MWCARGSGVSGLPAAEERPLEPPELRRREPRLREYLHHFVRDLRLFCRKGRWISLPVQTSSNVRVDPRLFARELIRESMQVLHLLEQRLELIVGNRRHDRPRVRLLPMQVLPARARFVLARIVVDERAHLPKYA